MSFRTAIIGLGNRGMATLRRFAVQPMLHVVALADLNEENLARAANLAPDADTYAAPDDWQRIAARDDVELFVICTDWQTHTPFALYAMQHGYHVAVEVPAATTPDEAEALRRTADETGRRCIMLENCCYDPFTLGTIEIVRAGLLGEITHLAGAYIHPIPADHFSSGWWNRYLATHAGNPYPTHAVGPICRILAAAGGDRFQSLYSAGTARGALNHTLITTERGRTVLLDFDTTTPRPYSRRQTVCGTRGFVEKYPVPTLCLGDDVWTGENAMQRVCSHIPAHLQAVIREGERLGVDNMMNFIMDTRLVHALQPDAEPDWSLADSLQWCAVMNLSEQSARSGQPVAF